MEGIEVVCVCVILAEQVKLKTVFDKERKRKTSKIYSGETVACKLT